MSNGNELYCNISTFLSSQEQIDCRYGDIDGKLDGSAAAESLAEECGRALPEVQGLQSTQLHSKNKPADIVNQARLSQLSGHKVLHAVSS